MACSVQDRLKTVRLAKTKVKSMLNIFCDIKGIVHKKIVWLAKQSILHTTVTFYGDSMKM
jgi:hypothetical protein